MKKVTYFGLLLAVALTGLSSCSSSDDVTSDPTNPKSGESRLTLTISTGDKNATTGNAKANSFNMGTRATDFTTDPGTAKEQQINHITVAIFSSDGKVRTIQQLTKRTEGDVTAGDGTYKQTDGTASATIVTNSLAATDKIYVVCNAPAGTFQGVQKATDFEAKTEGIDDALATEFGGTSTPTPTSLVDHNIPMYGQGDLKAVDKSDNFTASVTVQHQTAKVTLESLKVDFDQNGPYKDATFEPTGIFLINVPETLNFTTAAATTTESSSLFQGHDASTKATYREYLATPTITGTTLSGDAAATATNTFGNKYYFYTMPNSLDAQGKRTKLVIMGTFKSNGSGESATVYYPVSLNANYDKNGVAQAADGGTLFTVNPNKNYKCSVIIKTKGADSPNADLTPQQVAITVTVSGFTEASQTTIFN